MTLREHLERIRDRQPTCEFPEEPCGDPEDLCTRCENVRDALAALKILDESEIAWAYLNDELGDYCPDCGTTIAWDYPEFPNHRQNETRGRFVTDAKPA